MDKLYTRKRWGIQRRFFVKNSICATVATE